MSIERNDEKKQLLIKRLESIIYAESEKPISEKDIDLIRECVDFIAELEETENISDAQYEKFKKEFALLVKEKFHTKKPRRRIGIKLLVAAIIVILLLSAVSFSVISYDWNYESENAQDSVARDLIDLEPGEGFTYEGMDFYHIETLHQYDSVEKFLKEENLNVLYPSAFPQGTELINVSISDEGSDIYLPGTQYNSILFSTTTKGSSISLRPVTENNSLFLTNPLYEHLTVNGIEWYLLQEAGMPYIQCETIYKNIKYSVKANNRENVIFILNNIKEYEINE